MSDVPSTHHAEEASAAASPFAANLAALRECAPALADRLAMPDNDAEEACVPVQAEHGRRGLPTLKASDAQGTFYLHSLYDPEGEAERLVSQELPRHEFNVVVHIGCGLGYTLAPLMAAIDDKTTVVVVEPSLSAFRLALATRDLSEWLRHPRILWCAGETVGRAVGRVMDQLNLLKITGWAPLIAEPVHRLHKDYVAELVDLLSSELSAQRLGKATELIASEIFLKNSFTNLRHALGAPGITHLYQRWHGKPAVIVSAGPSLEKHLDLLAAHQDRILLIAVGAAWKSLRAHGIAPHLVVSVDPFPDNYPHFEGLEASREWLVTDFACNTDVVRTFRGRKIFAHSTPTKEALFRAIYGEWGIMLTGGSVANSAFSLALTLGAAPIILVGQDLAYTGGISHATGHTGKHTLEHAMKKRPAEFRTVPGYGHGEPVMTNSQMNTYRLWFERAIKEIQRDDVINATEGGARIEGAIEMPFAEALAQHATEVIDAELLWPEDYPNAQFSVRQISEQLAHIARKIRRIKLLSEEASAVMKKLGTALEKQQDCTPLELRYNRLAKRIGEQSRIADFFLTAFVQREMFLTQRRMNLRNDSKSDRYTTNTLLHEHLPTACQRAIDFLEEVRASLKAHTASDTSD